MGLINGAATYTRFTVIERIPDDFQANANARLQRFMFRNIDPKVNAEKSVGWVHYENPMHTRFHFENTIIGEFIVLAMRIDRKAITPIMFKAQIQQQMSQWAQDPKNKGKKISREELNKLRDEIKSQMLAVVPPQTTVMEMVWNFSAGIVYFSSQSRKAIEEFVDLFGTTFELTLNELDLVTRTEDFLDRSALDVVFEDLRPSRFRK